MIKQFIYSLILLLVSTNLYAVIDLTGDSSSWIPVLDGLNFDPGNDYQAGGAGELVGSDTQTGGIPTLSLPLFYTQYDDKGTPATADDEVAFRFRVDGAGEALDGSGNFEYSTHTWIGMDIDLDNSLDVFLLVKGKTGAYTLRIFEGGGDTNTSPSTSSITNPTDLATLMFGTDFHYDKTGTIEGFAASVDGVSSNANLDGDNNADFFVSFSMNFEVFAAIVNAKHLTDVSDIQKTSQDGDPVGVGEIVSTINGNNGFDKNTAVQFVLATSTQESSFNTDIGGYDDKVDDSLSFADQGAFSPPLSFSNLFPEITSNGGTDTSSITITSGLSATTVTTVVATDANSDPIKYSISGGADSAIFSIDPTTGVLTLGQNVINGIYVVIVKAEDLTDTLANGGVAIDSFSFDEQTLTVTVNAVADNTAPLAPSVDLLLTSDTGDSDVDDITNDITPTIRVTFDQNSTDSDVVIGDVVKLFENVTQVGSAILVAADITNGYVDITSSALNEGGLSFTATVTDAASNESTVSGVLVVSLDNTAPLITLNGPASLTIERAGGYLELGATASDDLDGVITANIATVNPVDADVVAVYTVTFNVDDTAGNSAAQVTRTVTVEDTAAPGVSILNQPASVNNLNAFTVTFQFDEVVSGFDSTDIILTNSTLTNFVNVGGVGDTYRADITPDSAADVSVGVNANAAQDVSSNDNTAAVTQITTFDSTPPNVAVDPLPSINLANQSAYTVSGTCTPGDGDVLVLLSQSTMFITPFTTCSAGGTWSATFDLTFLLETNGAPTLNVIVNATQTDSAGNKGTALIVETVKDTVKPGVQIQNVPGFVNANEFTISIVFDEDVTDFDSGDIAVTNGAVNVLSFNAVDAQTYTVGVIANGAGDITLNVAANVAQDLAGNDNNAATPVIAVFDDIAPVVTITNAAVVNAANVANYTVGGNCDNGDGNVTVTIAGATPATQNVNCTATNWTALFDVTLIGDGLNTVTVNASQTDAALNTGNATTVQVDKDVLITVPTVNVLVTNDATPVITGTADTGTSNEIVVGSATYTVIATVGNVWSLDTAAVIPDSGIFSLAGGLNEVAVTSTDAAGNSAADASTNELTLTLDDDNDGILNAVECPSGPPFDNTCTDTDGDGTPDFLETDSDNDGIPDANEVGLDTNNPIDSDGDGKPDYQDTDSDNDGIDDVIEGVTDTDLDGIPDYVDVGNTGDSDGDGIPDTIECPVYPGCTDTDGDGKPDYLDTDADNDVIDDAVEAGIDPTAPIDTDGDGIPDYQDTNSDDEGAGDSVEGLNDNDADGIPDYVDAASSGPAPNAGDSDGDGIADNIECQLYPLCADSDKDGTPDYMETDSDDDGIPDVNEAGSALNDADNDGIDDVFDIDITRLINGIDQNGDGVDDTQPLDTDGDGTPDYQDTDSDGDGIDDIVECPAGIPCPDADADGIPGQLDASDGDASGTDIIGSGDSDGDSISDFDECATGIPCSDVDQDGLPDYMDNKPDDGPAGDPDNDAILNYLDLDDDNDRIPDVVEDPDFDADNNPATNPLDSDLDGTPDYLDLDSDNDGLTDADESGASGNDSDGDNIDDSYDIDLTGGTDLNTDGIDDDVTPRDTDGDSLPDYLDTVFDGAAGTADTDNDGIPDDVECPVFPTDCPDTDNDGTPDFLETDSDGDGIDDEEETGSLSSGILLDTDGDGVPDYQDTDSDNDGVSDATEGLTTDSDADGIPDVLDADSSGAPFGGDSDGDGVVDLDECTSYPDCADSDNDGTPDYMDASFRPYDPDSQINTALNGVGSIGPWVLLLIPMTILIRRKIR